MHCVIIYFTEMTVFGYRFSPGSVSDKPSFAYSPDNSETTAETTFSSSKPVTASNLASSLFLMYRVSENSPSQFS